jgi:hypothetical protein
MNPDYQRDRRTDPRRNTAPNRCQRRRMFPCPSPDARRAAANGFQPRAAWGTFRGVLAGLRKTCPAAKPVVVRISKLPNTLLGDCARRRERFVIRINKNLDSDAAIEVLCHEWAHALAWNFSVDRLINAADTDPVEFERACHDEAWGCAYSRVWRAYLDVIREMV